MANFRPAFDALIAKEGGYVDHPNDPGGATKYGISLRWLLTVDPKDADVDDDGIVSVADIRAMTLTHAAALYLKYWWKEYRYGDIDEQDVATRIFSMSVNMGAEQAHKLVQRALTAAGQPVKVDGILGPASRAAIARANPWALIAAIRSEQAGYYRLIARVNPKLRSFLRGWLRRAYS
ncbi:MAG: glycosyl hydrolase 108 family protein [Pseudomonadota bacterium]